MGAPVDFVSSHNYPTGPRSDGSGCPQGEGWSRAAPPCRRPSLHFISLFVHTTYHSGRRNDGLARGQALRRLEAGFMWVDFLCHLHDASHIPHGRAPAWAGRGV